jgi:hypothetical protein
MKFDTSEKGLLTIFRPYQAALLEHIWNLNEDGSGSHLIKPMSS